MKTPVIVALLVAITIPPITTRYNPTLQIHTLSYCPRAVRQVSDLRTWKECCINPHTLMIVPGAAQYCCVNYNVCTGAAPAAPATTPSTTAAAAATTTTSAPLEGLDEPFLIWHQSSADTFPILKEDSDELTSVSLTEFSDVDKFLDKTTFIFRAGLCGESSTVSIESKHYPGKFWRHQNSIMKLHSKEETNLFKEDSCFKFSQGDCNDGSFTLESVNYPGYFIQICDSQMKIRTEAENCGDVSNKCWVNPVSWQASLAYCSTKVTDVLHVPLNPECCDHKATLESFGGCCREIMNDNDGCYEKPVSNPYRPPVSTVWFCPRTIHSPEDLAPIPECCLHPMIFRKFAQECCTNHGLCFRKRKKRQIQACALPCSAYNYCPRKMNSVSEWYQNYPDCCCHPIRKWMFRRNHPKLYNQECMDLGLPNASG